LKTNDEIVGILDIETVVDRPIGILGIEIVVGTGERVSM